MAYFFFIWYNLIGGNMQKIVNKIIWIIVIILVVGLLLLNIFNKKDKEYTSKFFYMDTYIYVKIYSNDSNKANKILKEVENIYKEYHELTDRYNSYNNIKNVYYIKNNKSKEEYIKIDKKLYDIIKFSIDNNHNDLIDIGMGNVIDIWKNYRDNKSGIPSEEELEIAKESEVKIVLKDGKIKNNHPNIDLGCISKGYTTKIVGEYLKKNGISKYLINAGGNVLVGDNYRNSEYKIGIEDPDKKNDIFTIVKGNNIAVVTSGGYERFYEYDGVKYSHIIDPNTLFPKDYMKSVTIITNDSALADLLSTTLFLMKIEDGKKYIESLDNVEAIWYTNDNKIIYSSGAKKYKYEKN